jgi:ABC-type Mn2+/Zn2+ transport system ATPase subunit
MNAAPSEVVRATGLAVGYAGQAVASGLSFSVSDGDVLAVVGPNGSGKTTLVRTLLGLMPPLGGSLSVLGASGPPTPAEAARHVAYIPQRLELDRTFPLSVHEFLSLNPRGPGAEAYLDMLELRPLLHRRMGELSGGQTQRALLAYAIMKEPRLLVMDEPTSWVDAKGADCIVCIIGEFKRRGIAMIMVTHDLHALSGVATHVLGVGAPETWFFRPVTDAALPSMLDTLSGTGHHSHTGEACRAGQCLPHCTLQIHKTEGHHD